MSDLTGNVIKGYELRQLISKGGFGVVYRAVQPLLEREVAIKIVLPEFANHPDFIRRFEVEAQLIARLEHLHIVPLYDYWREPDSAFLVMRWLKGGSLRQVLSKGVPPLEQTVGWIEQIAGALASAHRNGVIHQDLKPDNILLDEEQNAYLIDFGIAKDIARSEEPAEKQPLLGTPAYIAPEQILRHPISPQTDLYSLGIVLYELLTGETPFYDTDFKAVLYKHIHEAVPPLQRCRADLPDVLNDVLQKATAKSPLARYPDALSLAADVRRYARTITATPFIAPAFTEAETLGASSDPTAVISLEMQTQRLGDGTGTMVVEVDAPALLQASNPYKGLHPFTEADADDFFGREALVTQLLDRMLHAEMPFLALIGASGSGKSSVVKAGLIPLLRKGALPHSERWFYAQMVPGLHPFQEMAAALLSVALNKPKDLIQHLMSDEATFVKTLDALLPPDQTLLLVIDQFEELFTLVPEEEERQLFLNCLMHALEQLAERLWIIITLRADFYDRPLQYPDFGALVRKQSEVVLPLNAAEMRQAILAPAERAHLTLENGLVEAIIQDVQAQPGALPLLQYALTELFERRHENRLTLAAYQASGGVLGALARRADEIYEKLSPEAQMMAQQIFLRLVVLGEGVDDTRQRVSQADLLSMAGQRQVIQQVLETYGKYRLLAFDHDPQTRIPTVEVAHEAIIRRWERLRGWLNTNRENVRIQRRLAAATADWLNSGRHPGFLATGARLSNFESVQAMALTQEERDYLAASMQQRQQARQRVQIAAAALVIFSLGTLLLALFAFNQRSRAQASEAQALIERDRADAQAQGSRSRELAVNALNNRDQLDLSLLLSLEALQIADTFEAHHSLLSGLQAQPYLMTFLSEHQNTVRSVATSPDGQWLASADADGRVYLWEAATRSRHALYENSLEPINAVAFSPDSRWLAAGSDDGLIYLWDVTTGAAALAPLSGHDGAIWSVAFSPDGQKLASGGDDMTIHLWHIPTGNLINSPLHGHEDAIWSLAFSADGKWLASGSADTNIRLWDAQRLVPSGAALVGHSNWVMALAFTPNSAELASAGADRTVILWDIGSRRVVEQLATDHTNWIRSLAFSPDGALLATASADAQIHFWDMDMLTPLDISFNGHTGAVRSLAFSADGKTLLSGGEDRKVILWQVDRSHLITHRLMGHAETVFQVVFAPDGQTLYTGGGNPSGATVDNAIRVWNAATGKNLATWEQAHQGMITALALSPDGQVLASGAEDGRVLLWESSSGTLIQELRGHTGMIRDIAFTPDGKWIASASHDTTIRLWNVQTGESELLEGHESGVLSLAFSPDGQMLVSGSERGMLRQWNVRQRAQIGQPIPAHQNSIIALEYHPAGQLLVSASEDRRLILWDAQTMQPAGNPLLTTDEIIAVTFSLDGTMLASADDNHIILWDVATGRQLGQPLVGHSDWVTALAFDPTGEWLASGSVDTSIALWQVNVADWQALACQIANRNLTENEWSQYFYDQPYHATCPTVTTGE